MADGPIIHGSPRQSIFGAPIHARVLRRARASSSAHGVGPRSRPGHRTPSLPLLNYTKLYLN